MIRTAVICDQIRVREDVLNLLRHEGFMVLGCVDQVDAIQPQLREWAPEAIVVADPFARMDMAAMVQDLRALFPDASLLVLTRHTELPYGRVLYRNGANDVLTLPRGLSALPGALRDAVQSGPPISGAGIRYGKIVAVWSPKGGVGTSLIAANLAVALQLRQRLRTLLVDLCGPFGGAGALLGLKPERTLGDLFLVMKELSPMHLAQAVTVHGSGLSVLCAPRSGEPLGGLRDEYPSAVARLTRNLYDVTVMDVPAAWVPPVQAALTEADRVLVVVTPDAPAIQEVQAALGLLPAAQRERSAIGLVVNRVSTRAELQPAEIGRMVGLPVVASVRSAFVPLEPLVNTGKPVVQATETRGRAAESVAGDLERLAQRLA